MISTSVPLASRVRFIALCDGCDIEAAWLGSVEVGRVSPRGYLFHIRKSYSGWKPARGALAARNGLLRELAEWMRDSGLICTPDAPTP